MVSTDPIELFLARRRAAVEAGAGFDGTAAVLATASPDGRPSARVVLVKEVGPDGFFVYTNYGSRKARELAANPRAALCVHWPEIGEQFRIEGAVERATEARSDAYFAARPRDSQIGAWASPQSEPIEGREVMSARVTELEREHAGREIPRPPGWGGLRIVPERIERWVNREARLHDRWLYEIAEDGTWTEIRLAP